MKLGILTFSKTKKALAIGTKSIAREAKLRGHEVTFLFSNNVGLVFGNGKRITYQGVAITPADFDLILVRPGFTGDPSINASIIKQFQLAGFSVVNNYLAVFRAKNKIRTMQMLDHFGVPVPKTLVVADPAQIAAAAAEFTFPVIIKTIFGTHGTGVFIAESMRSLSPIVDYLTKKERGPIKLQEYIAEAKGKDIRAFVCGKKIVAAMERVAKDGEFRANFHKGGSVGSVVLSKVEQTLAIKAAQILGLDIAGVDILRTNTGPKIIEVNSNPGLEGISRATNIPVNSKVVDFLEHRLTTLCKKQTKPLPKRRMME